MKNDEINTNTIGYRGIVTLEFSRDGKVYKKVENHNAGFESLFRTLCKALAGYSIHDDRPIYMDIRKGPFTTTHGEPMLNKRVSISGASYQEDLDLNNWVCKLTASVSYHDFIAPSAIQDPPEIRLYLLDGHQIPDELAYLTLKEEDEVDSILNYLAPGTQILISWKLCFRNI